jgi:hypothetical protein
VSVPLKEVYDELDFTTDRISTECRTIALSVIALVWLFITGGKNAPSLTGNADRRFLIWAGVFAMATLLVDYLQYAFGFLATDSVRRRGEKAGHGTATFDYTAPFYVLRKLCFWAKQLVMLLALLWLALAIIPAM